jgi:hypothetical protein
VTLLESLSYYKDVCTFHLEHIDTVELLKESAPGITSLSRLQTCSVDDNEAARAIMDW